MKQVEMNQVIADYVQETGRNISDKVSYAFKNLLCLRDHWENEGKKDALLGRFSPPIYTKFGTEMDNEILDLLQQSYQDGYQSIKRGAIHENYDCLPN